MSGPCFRFSPRVVYGTLLYPAVAKKCFQVETDFGAFHATVATDTMQLEIQRIAEELRTSRGELSSALERSEDLRQKADLANRAKSEFLANMSHEIRTPLNGVLGLAGALAETEENPERKADLNTIVASGKSLLGVLNDILDFSKMEAGFVSLEECDFDPAQTVGEIAKLFQRQAEAKGLTLVLDVPEASAERYVCGDNLRLHQVISNLVGNAIKFTDEGSVTMRLRHCAAQNGAVELTIEVEDTGVGMDADALERVFERFTQADGSTTRKFGGTGLGLTIATSLVELMGGSLTAESKCGEGSTFTISLSLPKGKAPESDTSHAEIEGLMAAVDGLRLLVVDDNSVNQMVARRILERSGCYVEIADDGYEAVEIVKRVKFDAIIMDCMMPVIDGYEATRIIRALPLPTCNVPIVALTANVLPEDHDACRAAGMSIVVTKPVGKEALLAAIVECLAAAHTSSVRDGFRSVLFVDDEAAVLAGVRRVLKRQAPSWDLLFASDFGQAISVLESNKVCAVISDVHMPGRGAWNSSTRYAQTTVGQTFP